MRILRGMLFHNILEEYQGLLATIVPEANDAGDDSMLSLTEKPVTVLVKTFQNNQLLHNNP